LSSSLLTGAMLACSFGESPTMATVFSKSFAINDNVQLGRVLNRSAIWKGFVLDGFNDLKVCGIVKTVLGFSLIYDASVNEPLGTAVMTSDDSFVATVPA